MRPRVDGIALRYAVLPIHSNGYKNLSENKALHSHCQLTYPCNVHYSVD